MAYGAENEICNDEPQYFTRSERDDSTFAELVLKLDRACWMNPWAAVERVPKKWAELNLALYHCYENDFDLGDTKIVVMVAN